MTPRRHLQLLLLALLATLPVSAVHGHPGEYGTALHAHDVPTALPLAAREGKRVFVTVTPGGRAWQVFRWPDRRTRALVDLLVRETVIVERDAARTALPEGVAAWPAGTLLLLDADETLVAHWPADMPPSALRLQLETLFRTGTHLQQVRDARARLGEDHLLTRERLAALHWLRGELDQALALYRGCLADAIDGVSPAARSRRPWLFDTLATHAENSPAAAALLEAMQARAEARIISRDDRILARDLARLNGTRQRRTDTLALFDRLPATDSLARHGLADTLLEPLVEAGRGDELAELIQPVEALRGEIALYHRNRILRPASARDGNERGSLAFVRARAQTLIRLTTERGDHDMAAELRGMVSALDDATGTRSGAGSR